MPGSGVPALDVALGLATLFAVLALITSGLGELINTALSKRARLLEDTLRRMLDGSGQKEQDDEQPRALHSADLAAEMLSHPLAGSEASSRRHEGPAYLPSRVFATVLVDTLLPPTAPTEAAKPDHPSHDILTQAAVTIEALPLDSPLRVGLETALKDARSDRDRFQAGIEHWYDSAMRRLSGAYRRETKKVLFLVGLALAVGFNADAYRVTDTLWHDSGQRAAVVAAATKIASDRPIAARTASFAQQLEVISTTVDAVPRLQLPLGWSATDGDPRKVPTDVSAILIKVLGLIVTALAISLGAPFWFDVIGRGLSLRSSGPRPISATAAPTRNPS